jgi:chemotaxis signal transduction protein
MPAFLPVEIDGVWIALDAATVREVLPSRAWVPIPGATREIPGVLSWRGRAIALVDLGSVLESGEPLAPGRTRSRVVTLEVGSFSIAIPVDAVREVQEVTDAAVVASRRTVQRFSPKEVDLNGSTMPVLDLPPMLDALVRRGKGAA